MICPPSKSTRGFLKTEVLPSVFTFRPHVDGVFGHRKRKFRIRSLDWRFLKTPVYRIRVGRGKRWFLNTMTSDIGSSLCRANITWRSILGTISWACFKPYRLPFQLQVAYVNLQADYRKCHRISSDATPNRCSRRSLRLYTKENPLRVALLRHLSR